MKYLKKFNESNISVSDTVNDILVDFIDDGFFIRTYFNINETMEVVIAKCDFYRQRRSTLDIWDIITTGVEVFNLSDVLYDRIKMLNDILSDEYILTSYEYTDEYSDRTTSRFIPDVNYKQLSEKDYIVIKYKKI